MTGVDQFYWVRTQFCSIVWRQGWRESGARAARRGQTGTGPLGPWRTKLWRETPGKPNLDGRPLRETPATETPASQALGSETPATETPAA